MSIGITMTQSILMRVNTSLPVIIDISLLNLSAPAIIETYNTLRLMWVSSCGIKKYNSIVFDVQIVFDVH